MFLLLSYTDTENKCNTLSMLHFVVMFLRGLRSEQKGNTSISMWSILHSYVNLSNYTMKSFFIRMILADIFLPVYAISFSKLNFKCRAMFFLLNRLNVFTSYLEMILDDDVVKHQDRLNAFSFLLMGHRSNAKVALDFLMANVDRIREG